MSALHGVLVVDKPRGPTSHDVVARLRRALSSRAVGHAGTLDPDATGVLVVAVGEATKLVPWLTADDKSYDATVTFGRATDTLDASGTTTALADVPDWLREELAAAPVAPRGALARALGAELARELQVPPAYSAIKEEGVRAHARARAGLAVTLAPRAVVLRRVDCRQSTAVSLDVSLTVGKGYYVRAFARDLGDALGVPAHISALRRTASGRFTLADAVSMSAPEAELFSAVLPTATAAARVLPTARLTSEGAIAARQGKALGDGAFVEPPPDGAAAWLDAAGALVAVGSRREGFHRVDRGFAPTAT